MYKNSKHYNYVADEHAGPSPDISMLDITQIAW
jgi:hypothetical protein